MNKQILAITFSFVMFASMFQIVAAYGPITGINIIGNTTIYQEQKFAPLIFRNSLDNGRAVFDDPYGFYANGNASTRTNNYIFTGEQVKWKVLVWDKNGVEKIQDVYSGWINQTNGPLPVNIQSNCVRLATQRTTGTNLAGMGYSNVRRPGDQTDEVTFNRDTMAEYECTLTAEPNCQGQKWFGVRAIDLDNLNGTMLEAESWFCNPSIDLTTSGHIDFGALGPGEQGASTFSIKNNAEDGSGAQVILLINGKDFYDSSSSGAKCPTSNVMKLQGTVPTVFNDGFWYTVTQGAYSTGNKRIPYGIDITSADPVFSKGNGIVKNMTAPFMYLSPGAETAMTLHLGIPQPCNGQFTDGTINLWSIAI